MAKPHPALLHLVRHGVLTPDLTLTMPLVDSSIEHGLAPLLDDAVNRSGTPGNDDALMRLAAWTMKSIAHTTATSGALDQLIDTCSDLGIEPIVFKGRAVSERWYDRPELRPSYDIDVFVDPTQPELIEDLVAAFDDSPETQEAIAHMLTEGRVFEHTGSIGEIEIDVHSEPWMLLVAPRQQGVVAHRTELLTLPTGRSVRVPDLEMSLMISLIHQMRDNFADLLHILDVDRMLDAEPDWDFISLFAAAEGWTDMIRFSLGFACDTLDRPFPLPRYLTPRGRTILSTLWPQKYLLQGALSVIRSHRRQFLLGILVTGRNREIATKLKHRILPPRSYIDYRYPGCRCPYPIALARWRISQHGAYRRHSSRALNLREELAGESQSQSGDS